jgi:hypothetical protein
MGCQKLTYQNFELSKNYFRKELTSKKSEINTCSTYEVNDHLGNVRAVISDIKESDLDGSYNPFNFEPDVRVSYEKDNKNLKKVFKLYKKWVLKAKKIGLNEMRK